MEKEIYLYFREQVTRLRNGQRTDNQFVTMCKEHLHIKVCSTCPGSIREAVRRIDAVLAQVSIVDSEAMTIADEPEEKEEILKIEDVKAADTKKDGSNGTHGKRPALRRPKLD